MTVCEHLVLVGTFLILVNGILSAQIKPAHDQPKDDVDDYLYHDEAIDETIETVLLQLQKTIFNKALDTKIAFGQDDENKTVDVLLANIIYFVEHDEITAKMLHDWMMQLQDALDKHQITTERLTAFVAELKDRLEGSEYADECCPLG